MDIIEIIIIAIGLAMDAFAVAIGKGLSISKVSWRHYLLIGLWFGGFQALMPLIGYLLGTSFANVVAGFDHWIVFALLSLIGSNMIKESFSRKEDQVNADISTKTMFLLSIATSIDALAAGVSFAFFANDIIYPVLIIGIITFALSTIGVKIGNIFGNRYKRKAEFAGGVILIIIGIKILFEHLSLNL